MKVENLKEAFENLLQNLRWSKYELAINCGISYSTLKSIFDGCSNKYNNIILSGD